MKKSIKSISAALGFLSLVSPCSQATLQVPKNVSSNSDIRSSLGCIGDGIKNIVNSEGARNVGVATLCIGSVVGPLLLLIAKDYNNDNLARAEREVQTRNVEAKTEDKTKDSASEVKTSNEMSDSTKSEKEKKALRKKESSKRSESKKLDSVLFVKKLESMLSEINNSNKFSRLFRRPKEKVIKFLEEEFKHAELDSKGFKDIIGEGLKLTKGKLSEVQCLEYMLVHLSSVIVNKMIVDESQHSLSCSSRSHEALTIYNRLAERVTKNDNAKNPELIELLKNAK